MISMENKSSQNMSKQTEFIGEGKVSSNILVA